MENQISTYSFSNGHILFIFQKFMHNDYSMIRLKKKHYKVSICIKCNLWFDNPKHSISILDVLRVGCKKIFFNFYLEKKTLMPEKVKKKEKIIKNLVQFK